MLTRINDVYNAATRTDRELRFFPFTTRRPLFTALAIMSAAIGITVLLIPRTIADYEPYRGEKVRLTGTICSIEQKLEQDTPVWRVMLSDVRIENPNTADNAERTMSESEESATQTEQENSGAGDAATQTEQENSGAGDAAAQTEQEKPGAEDAAAQTEQEKPGAKEAAAQTKQEKPGAEEAAAQTGQEKPGAKDTTAQTEDTTAAFALNKREKVLCVLEYEPKADLSARVRVTGKVSPYRGAMNEGEFDLRLYYHILGIEFSLRDARILAASGPTDRIAASLFHFKKHISDIIDRVFSTENAPVLKAMLLGEKGLLQEETKELYQGAGIIHILSISGLHLSLIGMGIFSLTGKLRIIPVPVRAALSVLAVFMYGKMIGMGTSAFRALVMLTLYIISKVIGRTYDILTAAGIAAFLLLIDQPLYILHTGFQFSFGAVLAIGILMPALPGRALKTIAIPLITLPVYMCSFGTFPVSSLLLNLIVIPLMTAVMVSAGSAVLLEGLLAKLAGFLPVATAGDFLPAGSHFITGLSSSLSPMSPRESGSPIIEWPARLAGFPAELILDFYRFLAETVEKIPAHEIVLGRPSAIQIILYYIMLILMAAVSVRLQMPHMRRRIEASTVSPADRKNKEDDTKTRRNAASLWIIPAGFFQKHDNTSGNGTLFDGSIFPKSTKTSGSGAVLEGGIFQKSDKTFGSRSVLDGIPFPKNRNTSEDRAVLDSIPFQKNRNTSGGGVVLDSILLHIVQTICGLLHLNDNHSRKKFACICSALWAAAAVLILTAHRSPAFEMDMLYVGQGDGIFISSEGRNLLIDGGSSTKENLAKYTLLPFLHAKGVSRLDGVILTHDDGDHCSGLLELLEPEADGNPQIAISKIYLPDIAETAKGDRYREIEELSEQSGIPVCYISRGQRIRTGSLTLDCLHPARGAAYEDANEYSTTLLLRYADSRQKSSSGTFSALLTGDIEGQGEEDLLRYIEQLIDQETTQAEDCKEEQNKDREGSQPEKANRQYSENNSEKESGKNTGNNSGNNSGNDSENNSGKNTGNNLENNSGIYSEKNSGKINITLLKVAHHGSKNATSEEFLEMISPEIALISAGIDNMYGHPSDELLERLRTTSPQPAVFRTDLQGEITIWQKKGGEYQVKTFLGKAYDTYDN